MTDLLQAVSIGPNTNRLLATLERLLAIDETDLHGALNCACHMVAEALGADKVDAVLHDAATESGRGRHQPYPHGPKKAARHRLDRLPVANGGREVEVFLTGERYATGRADYTRGNFAA